MDLHGPRIKHIGLGLFSLTMVIHLMTVRSLLFYSCLHLALEKVLIADFQATQGWLTRFIVSNTGSHKKIYGCKSTVESVKSVFLRQCKHHAKNPTSTNVSFKEKIVWMTLSEKKLYQSVQRISSLAK